MSDTGVWPLPGDSPTAILKRVTGAYRARLSQVDPEGCAAIDRQMVNAGQRWVTVRLTPFEMDEWISAKEAADLACVQVCRIARLRRQGVLKKWRLVGRNEYQYRVEDVYAAFATKRARLAKVQTWPGGERGEGGAADGVERRAAAL